ncbi:MAG: ribose 5-phosphate isomerase B [Tissierellales bacterium]
MKIGLGSDHAGYELMGYIKEYLDKKGIEYIDFGTNSNKSVDYPEFGQKTAEAVKSGECHRGIICCGTGIGISISANKVPGIRCALCGDCYSARMSIEHNNANVLAIGARVTGKDLALEIIDTWLKAEFLGGKHEKRINKIKDIENKYVI